MSNESATIITLDGNVTNSGAIDLQGGGAGCPETDSILIRSTSAAQRAWTGAGRYRLVDVDVQNMGGTGTKTVFSGTNSGGNNTTWVFNANCPTALSITPSTASVQTGATQTFTAGGGIAPYSFSILTNNSDGSINASTGVYTAGTTAGVIDTIRVTDVFGTTADASVNVLGTTNKLTFIAQPESAIAGQTISPIHVAVQDEFGNTVTNSNASITLSFFQNTNGATLSGTITRNAVGGIAVFDNLSIDKANTYNLKATSGSLSGTSNPITIFAGAPHQLVFITQPVNTFQSRTILPPVEVAVADSLGNVIQNPQFSVTIAIGNNPGGGALLGNPTRDTLNGVAGFLIAIDKPGSGYTLTASVNGLPTITSNSFDVINPFLVTNTDDSGIGSLRQAITNANNFIGVIGLENRTIVFNIPGTAPYNIIRGSQSYPFLGNGVSIDGTTQPGFSGTPIINLFGTGVSLVLSGGSSIKGLIVGGGTTAILESGSQNRIQGNHLRGSVEAVNARGFRTIIGGSTPAERNVISNSGAGILLAGANEANVAGNYIGTDPTGLIAQPNNVGIAILGSDGSASVSTSIIGGDSAAEENLIAFNNKGITVTKLIGTPSANIKRNSIYSNTGLGIDLLGSSGVTPNDPLDPDTGPNELQNFPVLDSAISSASNVIINGSLNSVPLQNYTLNFYSNAACDVSGFGEGETFIGSTNVLTDADGNAGFSANLPVSVPIGRIITSTATDANGNTSEFSRCSNSVIGVPSRLAFVVQPSNASAHTPIAPPVQVAIQDVNGNTITNANDAVTIGIGNNPSSGTLSGTLTRNALGGVATFDVLKIDNAGNGYTLVASSGSLTPATSAAFNIISPFVVTNTNDSGAGSLRQAILNANQAAGTQTISFNIAGAAPFSIVLTSALPDITDSVIVDGTTQTGFAGTPIVELNGSNVVDGNGFTIFAGNCVIKGFVINRFFHFSTLNSAIYIAGNNNSIEGNYLGTNLAGSVALKNAVGITISPSSTNNRIGGANAAARNVISGNEFYGIFNFRTANSNLVQGNYIGTNAAGNAAVGNQQGIFFISNNNSIDGNLISGNELTGISLAGANNRVRGNIIGRNVSNSANLANGDGIILSMSNASTTGNIIGGTLGGAGNVIAGNSRYGIGFHYYSSSVGVNNNNLVSRNSIFQNGSLGISLNSSLDNIIAPPLPNDPLDADAGANNRQNYPVLTSAVSSGGSTTLTGTFNSAPSQTFTLDFYSNAACDASGNGEGETYLGSTNVTTDAGGIVGFTANLPVSTALGRVITATATDASGNTSEFSRCVTVSPVTYSISGRITLQGSTNGLAPLTTLTLAGTNRTTVSNSNGFYSFTSVPGNISYHIVPNLFATTFSPFSRFVPSLTADVSGQDFVATQTGQVQGVVESFFGGSRFGLSGATVNFSGPQFRSVQTDSFGNYRTGTLVTGSYTVTVFKAGYTFTTHSVSVGSNVVSTLNMFGTAPPVRGRVLITDGNNLRVMNADGSGLVRIASATNGLLLGVPSMRSSGSEVAYTRTKCPFSQSVCATTEVISSIFTANADGSNERIAASVNSGISFVQPAFSPDGTKLAFVQKSGGAFDQYASQAIFVQNRSTGVLTRVFSAASGTFVNDIEWSPDGTKLAFVQRRSNAGPRIYTISSAVVNGTPTQLTTSDSTSPTWSPNGSLIAYIAASGSVRRMNSDGSEQIALVQLPGLTRVSWSPDGAFLGYLQSGSYGVMTADGNQPTIYRSDRTYAGIYWGSSNVLSVGAQLQGAGQSTFIQAGAVNITFNAPFDGEVSVIPIPTGSVGVLPNEFASTETAYNIVTDTPAGAATVCVELTTDLRNRLDKMHLLHDGSAGLTDITIARDPATGRVCGGVTSFGNFVVAEQIDPGAARITGLVQDNNGAPIPDVAVTLSGAGLRTAYTDSRGVFSFVNLTTGGNYNVSPKQVGYMFTEYNQDFINLSGEQTVMFVGTAADFQISGKITGLNENGLSDVTVDLDGAVQMTAQTDANGSYVFTGLPADGFYTITPSNGVHNFSPATAIVEALTSDAAGIDFQGVLLAPTTTKVTVGGRVTADARGVRQARVTLTGADGRARTTVTDAFGYYRFSDVPAGETYIISVRYKLYSFENGGTLVVVINNDRNDLNFTVLPAQPSDESNDSMLPAQSFLK